MKSFIADKKYLLFPIAMDAPCKTVAIWTKNEKIYEFDVPIGESGSPYRFQYYAPLNIESWRGQEIFIEVEDAWDFLEAIGFSDDNVHTEQHKPQIHFSPEAGWINDPNGLVYADGIYHLYFQYNPFQNQWGNLCWGHAVSEDLLHWKQLDTVMFPEKDGSIFSGCGIVNERGLLKLPESALLFFYTMAGGKTKWSEGKKFTQRLAYSLDGGKTLQKTAEPVIDHIADENRDPKVYWHENSQAYYMVLFLEGHRFGVFRSENLQDWECTQTLELDEAWECPDLREIPVEDGGSRWVFWSADGFYFLGEFDGYRFITDGIRREAYQTTIPYAAQTFYGVKDVISVSWLRTQNNGQYYRGVMALPRKMTLVRSGEDIRLRMMPVENFLNARKLVYEDNTCELKYKPKDTVAIQIQLLGAGKISYVAEINGNNICFDWEAGSLTVNEQQAFMGNNIHEMSILIDAEICEVTTENGLYYGVFELNPGCDLRDWSIRSREMLNMKVMEIS